MRNFLLMITKYKIKKIKRQIYIKIINLAIYDIYPVVFIELFIKIIFLFNQMILKIDTHIKLIK